MKKLLIMFLSVIVMFACVISLSACSSNDEVSIADEEYTEEEYTEEEYAEEDDPLGVLLAEYLPYDGERWYLVRDGQTYSLNSSKYYDEENSVTLYSNCFYYDLNVVQNDFEIPVLQEGDTVISTFPRDIPVLKLFEADFYGWGIPLSYAPNGTHELWVEQEMQDIGAYDLRIEDEAGNTYEDPYNLKEGECYKVSWCDARMNDYQFYDTYANYKTYKLDNPDEWYEVEGVQTESGRAEYDLSDIPPGLYRVGDSYSGGFLEIK